MAERKFQRGDLVRNVGSGGPYHERIKDKIGVFQRYWSDLYTLRAACDVTYPGVVDLYGREDIAQSADDLVLVIEEGDKDATSKDTPQP